MSKINILYVIWSLGLGGAEQVVKSLVKGLNKAKFRPFICCLNDEGRFADELKAQGIQVFALNKKRGIDFSVVPKLVKIIKENNINVVHTHLWGANLWGRLAANEAHIPVVVTEHNVDVWKNPIHFVIDRFLFRKTDCFVAVSEMVRGFYSQKLGVTREKIEVVYNGVEIKVPQCPCAPVPQQKNIKNELGINDDEKVIAVIGRLVPQKGIEFFLNAMKGVFNHRPSTIDNRLKILIVGEGPLLNNLKLKVKNEKLEDKVEFLGFRKDIPEILSITDILVLPSSREGLPMILLEAMAAGVIVVATRVGGTPELLQDGFNGFLIEYGDAVGLEKEIQHILTMDERTRDEIIGNAKNTVKDKFSLEKMVVEHERIYQQLIAQ